MLDLLQDVESATHCPIRVVLVRPWVPEVDHDAIAEELGDVAAMHLDGVVADTLVVREEIAQILGVETLRQSSRSDQIDEETGDLAALPKCVLGLGLFERFATAPAEPGLRHVRE